MRARSRLRIVPSRKSSAAAESLCLTDWMASVEVTSESLEHAARVISSGGVVAYPTEYCFGLGCDPRQPLALAKVLKIKRREAAMGMILIAATEYQLQHFLDPALYADDQALLEEARATWPGPVSWLLPPHKNVHHLVRGNHERLAVRVTAHHLAARLCLAAGTALVSTSANPHGMPPARSARQVELMFGDDVDYVLAGRVGSALGPSELREAGSGRILRAAPTDSLA